MTKKEIKRASIKAIGGTVIMMAFALWVFALTVKALL